MKLQAELNNEKHEIEIKREGEKVFARIDDREYELEASQPEPNVYLFKNEGKIYQIFVSPRENSAEPFAVKVGNHRVRNKIIRSEKTARFGRVRAQTLKESLK